MASSPVYFKKGLYAAVLILVALPLLYFASVFFRASVVPFYVNTFYRGSAAKKLTAAFSNINPQLNALGFEMSPQVSTCYNGISDNGNAWYHGISETVLCTSKIQSSSFVPSTRFKVSWKQAAPKLAKTLRNEGWKSYYADVPNGTDLLNLYDDYSRTAGAISYRKTDGKYSCELDLEYSNYSGQPSTNNNTKADVTEICQRYVSFFGGSGG